MVEPHFDFHMEDGWRYNIVKMCSILRLLCGFSLCVEMSRQIVFWMIVFVFACARSIRGYRNRRVLIRWKLCTFTNSFFFRRRQLQPLDRGFFLLFLIIFTLIGSHMTAHTDPAVYISPFLCFRESRARLYNL